MNLFKKKRQSPLRFRGLHAYGFAGDNGVFCFSAFILDKEKSYRPKYWQSVYKQRLRVEGIKTRKGESLKEIYKRLFEK